MAGNLSATDLGRVGALLTDAAREFAEHSCNDFGCAATAENKAMFIAIIRWQAGQPWGDTNPQWLADVERAHGEKEQIFAADYWAMGYFAQRCQALAKNTAGVPGFAPAELLMIAALLDVMVEFREIDLEDHDISVDYTLSATDENKQFLAAVIENENGAGWERRREEVMESDDEIVVPEPWVTRYFSHRCKELAA